MPKKVSEEKKNLDTISEVVKDGFADINERRYSFGVMLHKTRRSVYAYASKIQPDLVKGDFSFLDDPRYDDIEKIMFDSITYDGMQLSKINGHWDIYPEDYVFLVTIAMGVISSPFTKGVTTV